MEIRELSKDEFIRFNEIDRREIIEHIYYHRRGKLELENEYYDVQERSPEKKKGFIDDFNQLNLRGGFVYAVFDKDNVAGIGTLDIEFIGKDKDQLQLAGLWVTQKYRKKGVATMLVEHMKNKAKALGAKKLYVSATPSLNTVTFYQNRGFILTKDLDKKLFEKEPEDIHIILTL